MGSFHASSTRILAEKTLFEIASGLGIPLTIDDATLQQKYGMFARILIDIDL